MNPIRFYKPKLFWLAAFLLALLPAWGQVRYPVTVSGYQVRPSLFLDDYTLAGTRNMSAALVLNDLTEAEGRQVFLRFGIESSAVRIQARQGWFPQETVTLYPGEVLSLNDQTYTQIFFQKCLMFSKTYRSFVQWLIPSHPGKPARPTAIFARRSGWG